MVYVNVTFQLSDDDLKHLIDTYDPMNKKWNKIDDLTPSDVYMLMNLSLNDFCSAWK